jgi:hypothetical protein
MYVSMWGVSTPLGACPDAEPRRCGQRHKGGANADQEDSCGQLAREPDGEATDDREGCEHVVEARVGRERNGALLPDGLEREAEQHHTEHEGDHPGGLAEAEDER